MRYPREYLGFAERYVKEHPRRVQELRDTEDAIAARCRGSALSDTVGRFTASEQEILLTAKENDALYLRLERQVGKIREAMGALSPEEYELVDLLLFEEMFKTDVAAAMNIDIKTVWRIKNNALGKILPFIVDDL